MFVLLMVVLLSFLLLLLLLLPHRLGEFNKSESGLCLWLHINGTAPLLCKSLGQLICTQYFADNFTACVMDISLNMTVSSLKTGAVRAFLLQTVKTGCSSVCDR